MLKTRPSIAQGILFLLVLAVALAEPGEATQGSRFHTRNYTEQDGLPGAYVRGIIQDTNGCIWITNRTGVACYDGTRWKKYEVRDGLRSVDLNAISMDEAGRLWVCSHSLPIRLAWFDGSDWISPPPHGGSLPDSVTCMAVRGSGATTEVLVATSEGGLFCWREGPGQWSQIPIEQLPGPIDSIQFIDEECIVLSGQRPFELSLTPPHEITEQASPVRDLRAIFVDEAQDRRFFVGTSETHVQQGDAEPTLWKAYDLHFPRTFRGPFQVVQDSSGGFYFGNAGGVYYQPAEGEVRVLGTLNSLLTVGTTCIMRDREDNVWVGSPRGLSKIVSRRFENLDSSHGLFLSEVTGVLERSDGTIVLGHPGGLTFLEDEPRRLKLGTNLVDARVLDFDEDQDGTLWVAATWYGLVEISADGTQVLHGEADGLGLPVNTTFIDEDNTLWIGTGEGVYRKSQEGFARIEKFERPGPKRTFIRHLTRDRNGIFRAGTGARGILSWDSDLDHTFSTSRENPLANNAYCAYTDQNGVTWAGTSAGLFIVQGEQLVEPEFPRIQRPIYFISGGAEGRIWFGTNNGVFLLSGESFRHLTVQQGLSGSETNRAAYLLDRNDRHWIGTSRGVSVYQAEFDLPRATPPTVEVVSCDVPVQDKEFEEDGMVVPNSRNQLSFGFRAIAFTDEKRVRFQTFLEGLDEDWSEPELNPLRRATYAYLPPGSYTFNIRAVDTEGQVSEVASWMPITIRQPAWNEAWFRALAALAGIALVSIIVTLVVQRRDAARLEEEVSLRTRELSESQDATERERRRLELTLANIADGVAAVSSDGRVVLWNSAAEEITGWEEDMALGEPLNALLGTSEILLSEGRHYLLEGQDRFGDKRLFEISNSRTESTDGSEPGLVIAFRDVTDKLEVDREMAREEKLEALGLLAGGIAHDFNNLLTVIIGNLSVPLPDNFEDAEYREGVEDASAAAKSARSLTRQLMTFSKGGEPVRQATSIATILRDTSTFFLSGSDVTCSISVADDLWLASIDEGQIGQVIHNLLLNAREAMPNGGNVHIRATNLDTTPAFLSEADYVMIEVEDEGVGVTEEDATHIFDPYFSTKSRGSGLGLAIAYSIVQRHDGHITVDSEVGVGSTFRIYLRALTFESESEMIPAARPEKMRSGRILVMDDEEPIRRVVTNMLTRVGYTVTSTRDGAEAVREYERALNTNNPFDVVIMDLTVPGGMGGKEAMRRLREIHPEVRAIVASGYSNDPVVAHAIEYGFKAEVSKPFGMRDLTQALDRVLSEAEIT